MLKTAVKRKFLTSPFDPFVTLDVSDAQNCGKMQILDLAEQPFRHRTCQTLKTVVNGNSTSAGGNPVVTSCVSDAQNYGKMDILDIAERPFRHFVCGGSCENWCFCGGCGGGVVVFLWWCG